ncbi:hypothetical protein B0J14DRAFT_653483 [Halenospora varia]|nr:hypothetical protein B0J14DRAFT_653483 [Halenospora varia]
MTSFEMSPIRSVVSPEVDEEVREHRLSYVGGNQLGWPVNDPSHPRNWSSWVKAFNLFVIVSLEFTTYLYGLALSSIVFSSVSESFGRKPLYILSMFLYSGLCFLTGTVPHIADVAVGRFCCGLASSIPTIVVAGGIEDMFDSEKRVRYKVPMSPRSWDGDGYFGQRISTLKIPKSRLARLNKVTGAKEPFTIDDPDSFPTFHEFITASPTRPTKLYFTEPIVFLVSTMASVAFGRIYLLTVAIPVIYTQKPL